MTTVDSGSNLRQAWLLAGSLLLAAVVLGASLHAVTDVFRGVRVLAPALFAASLLVFALGLHGVGSVTARRPLGTAALAILAVWVLVAPLLTDILGTGAPDGPSAALVFSLVDPYVRFALALVAVVQVGRARVVAPPWNWLPAWVLAALTVPWVIGQVVAASVTPGSESAFVLYIGAFEGLVGVVGAVAMGIVAIVLADRDRGRTSNG
jgi:hypothetical protein